MNLESILSLFQTILGKDLEDALCFISCTAERNHELHVIESHIISNMAKCTTFELKGVLEIGVQIARRSTNSNHWIFLLRFKAFTTNETTVFVGLKVAEADNDWAGIEGCRDAANSLGELSNEKVLRRSIVLGLFLDNPIGFFAHTTWKEHSIRVDTNVVCNHKLLAHKSNTCYGEMRMCQSCVGVGENELHLGLGFGKVVNVDLCTLNLGLSLIHMSTVTVRTVHRILLACLENIRGITSTNDARDSEFSTDNSSMTRPSTTVCYYGRRHADSRHP